MVQRVSTPSLWQASRAGQTAAADAEHGRVPEHDTAAQAAAQDRLGPGPTEAGPALERVERGQ